MTSDKEKSRFERYVLPKVILNRCKELTNRFGDTMPEGMLSMPYGADFASTMAVANLMVDWDKEQRPYYRLYPSVIEFVLGLNIERLLHLDLNKLPFELKTLEIEVPREYWSTFGFKSCVIKPSFLDSIVGFGTDIDGDDMDLLVRKDKILEYLSNKDSLDEALETGQIRGGSFDSYLDLAKLVYGILAIGEDPGIVRRCVLSSDKRKYEETQDIKYVEKAKRRGVFGFEVGKDIPTKAERKKLLEENDVAARDGRMIPHVRIAHYALYWTDKGRKVPKIILRKSCVVNKDLLEKMPQGYYGKEKS